MAEIIELMPQEKNENTQGHRSRRWIEPGEVFLLDHVPFRLEIDRQDEAYQYTLIGFFGLQKIERTLPGNGFADFSMHSDQMIRLMAIHWNGDRPVRCFIESVNVTRVIQSLL